MARTEVRDHDPSSRVLLDLKFASTARVELNLWEILPDYRHKPRPTRGPQFFASTCSTAR